MYAQYTRFRYGQPRKPVTLARIFKGEARLRIEDDITEAMRDWRETPFENEGPFRAALRSTLCLQGHAWNRADAEAAELVQVALHRQGAKRPTWEEGQLTYTESPDFCSWCRGPLSADDIASARRFCCAECTRMALTRRDYGAPGEYSPVRQSIRDILRKLESKPRVCTGCGKQFQSRNRNQKFCSHQCKFAGILIDINCDWCGKTFRQKAQSQLYCSNSCRGHGTNARATMHTLTCEWCSGTFQSKKSTTKYCCTRHNDRAIYAKKAAARLEKAKVVRLTPAIFDEWFKEAA